jgi:hypothetical protein
MEIIRHALFPVLVGETQNSKHAEIKPALEKQILQNYLDKDGYSHERTGHVILHHDPVFEELFEFITFACKEWLATYMIHPDIFNFNIVKTWMNILKDQATPYHHHGDSHISFTYYINVPEDNKKPIIFHNYNERYEPFPGCIRFNNPVEWNAFNSYGWSFPVEEGKLLIFPSRLAHNTEGNLDRQDKGVKCLTDLHDRRVCLAGDIVLTYKETSAKTFGLQPVENWRIFKTHHLQ